MKKCRDCGEEKPLAMFVPDKRQKDGRTGYCRGCRNIKTRALYKKNPKKFQTRNRKWTVANRAQVTATTVAWQKAHPGKVKEAQRKNRKKNRAAWLEIIRLRGLDQCSSCGYRRNFAAIEFHHANPNEKDSALSCFIKRSPSAARIKELDKCIALCANCHRELHNAGDVQ